MAALIDQLDEALDLVDAGDAAGGQLRQPEVDCVAFLDRQGLGGLDKTAIEPNTAPIDSGVVHLAVALGDARMPQFRMRPHRAGCDDVEAAALEQQLALGFVLDPIDLIAVFAAARFSWPAQFPHGLGGLAVLAVGQPERLREQPELGGIGVARCQLLRAVLHGERNWREAEPRHQNQLVDRALEFVVMRDQLPVVGMFGGGEEGSGYRITR